MKKETLEQLDLFRRQQEEAERKSLEDDNSEVPTEDQVQWVAPGRKRKKGPETSLLKGIKLRKSMSAAEEKGPVDTKAEMATASAAQKAVFATSSTATGKAPAMSNSKNVPNNLSLGLGYASSDEDD